MKSWFINLNLAKKLSIGFGTCVFLAMIIGWAGFSGMRQLTGHVNEINRDAVGGLASLNEFSQGASLYRLRQARMGLTDDKDARAKLLDQVNASGKKADQALAEYKKSVSGQEDEANFAKLSKAWSEYTAIGDQINGQLVTVPKDTAGELFESRTTKQFNEILLPALNDNTDWNNKQAQDLVKQAESSAASGTRTIIFFALFAALLSVGISIVITRSVTVPVSQINERVISLEANCVRDLKEGLEAFASGDLTVGITAVTTPVPYTAKDELGRMAATFNSLLTQINSSIASYNEARCSLSTLVGKVVENAVKVAGTSQNLAAAAEESSAAASQIASGSDQLASSATEAAERVRQVVSGVGGVTAGSQTQGRLIEQMSAAISQSASGIASVSESAVEMEVAANQGNLAVKETVSAMERVRNEVARSTDQVRILDEKGQEIGQIVGAIEEIAAQTNLLALNAAIEAARAGEHGRGFAVVADEVRKLAEQSSQSTKQISQLIQSVTATVEQTVGAIRSAQNEVTTGTQKSQAAGNALDQILLVTKAVQHHNQNVADLSKGLSANMEEILRTSSDNLASSIEIAGDAKAVLTEIDGVAAVSEESAAAVEELSATISEVGSAANELSGMSQDLTELVASFKIDARIPIAAKPQPKKANHLRVAV